ncbi:PKD domain-containing protein [Nocardioides sp.]|uniref:PKD domain-containing protein n=1 Tax=Nocardioides sp. TaxID=35761 RepID=UPI00260317C8|nr:PKD domain-containing protein [Nocardioides sp.]
MTSRSLAVLCSLVAASLVATPQVHADEPVDTTAPTGSYRLAQTTTYLASSQWRSTTFEAPPLTATVTLVQTALDDPSALRWVDLGDGSDAVAWRAGTSLTLTYDQAGVFTPSVSLSDAVGNASTVRLPAVTVRRDTVRPTVRLRKPKKPKKISSWKVVRGTASDRETGMAYVDVYLMQRDGGRWWGYDFPRRRWFRITDPAAEGRRFHHTVRAAELTVRADGTWVTPPIKRMKKLRLLVEYHGRDRAGNAARTWYPEYDVR